MLDRAVTELVCILGKTLGVKITVGRISGISFIEDSCYGPASSLAGPTRTSCGLIGPVDGLYGGLSQCRQCTRQRGAIRMNKSRMLDSIIL